MKRFLTWEEYYQLALKNYCNGGDGVVECWDESTYNECGPYTEEEALRGFHLFDSVRKDIQNA